MSGLPTSRASVAAGVRVWLSASLAPSAMTNAYGSGSSLSGRARQAARPRAFRCFMSSAISPAVVPSLRAMARSASRIRARAA